MAKKIMRHIDKVFFGAVLILAFCCLFYNWCTFVAIFFVALINAYLLFVMFGFANYADKSDIPGGGTNTGDFWNFLPTRVVGLGQFFLFLMIIILSFARIYLNFPSDFDTPYPEKLDAIYTSFGTLTTVTMGGFTPTSSCAKWAVMFEIVSAINFLFCAVPLLISRLSIEVKAPGQP